MLRCPPICWPMLRFCARPARARFGHQALAPAGQAQEHRGCHCTTSILIQSIWNIIFIYHTDMYMYIYIYMYICMSICIYIYNMYVCMYIYIYMWNTCNSYACPKTLFCRILITTSCRSLYNRSSNHALASRPAMKAATLLASARPTTSASASECLCLIAWASRQFAKPSAMP